MDGIRKVKVLRAFTSKGLLMSAMLFATSAAWSEGVAPLPGGVLSFEDWKRVCQSLGRSDCSDQRVYLEESVKPENLAKCRQMSICVGPSSATPGASRGAQEPKKK